MLHARTWRTFFFFILNSKIKFIDFCTFTSSSQIYRYRRRVLKSNLFLTEVGFGAVELLTCRSGRSALKHVLIVPHCTNWTSTKTSFHSVLNTLALAQWVQSLATLLFHHVSPSLSFVFINLLFKVFSRPKKSKQNKFLASQILSSNICVQLILHHISASELSMMSEVKTTIAATKLSISSLRHQCLWNICQQHIFHEPSLVS